MRVKRLFIEIKAAIGAIIICIMIAGCVGEYVHFAPSADVKRPILPEKIYKQPPENYYRASKVGVFRFLAPSHQTGVGYTAGDSIYQALLNNNTFSEVVPELYVENLSIENQFKIAREKEFDLIVTGRILYYLDGTHSHESRVDEELAVYEVKTERLIWLASAAEICKPISKKDYFIIKIHGEHPSAPTVLFAKNAQKFINMFNRNSI